MKTVTSEKPNVILVICVMIQNSTKMELGQKKTILTFVPIQSGDISDHRSFHILLQRSAVTSSSDKRRWNRDVLSRIVELSRLPGKRHYSGRNQSIKIDDRKSNRSIDANRCRLVNWHRLVLANQWPIDSHPKVFRNHWLPSIGL